MEPQIWLPYIGRPLSIPSKLLYIVMFGRMDKKTTVRNAETDYPHFAPSKPMVCAVQTSTLSRPNCHFEPSKPMVCTVQSDAKDTDPTPAPPLHGRGVPTDRHHPLHGRGVPTNRPRPLHGRGVPTDRPRPLHGRGVPTDRPRPLHGRGLFYAAAAPLPCRGGAGVG